MSLRELAESDLGVILEDAVTGFGWPITLTNPAGVSESLVGRSGDVGLVIDPDTGQSVSGRTASVSLRISSIFAAGFTSLPVGISDATSKPWLVTFDDIGGVSCTFKIVSTPPDRTLGIMTCFLEFYQ